MLHWIVRLWNRMGRWMHRNRQEKLYRPSNLHGRHR